MIKHPKTYTNILDDSDVSRILDVAFDVLSSKGICIQSRRACELLAEAGAEVDFQKLAVKVPVPMAELCLKKVPSSFTLYARNEAHNVTVGNEQMLIVPGYGSAFVAEANGKRRLAGIEDFERLASWSGQSDVIDITGGLLVEPNDIRHELRSLEVTHRLLKYSDKPFMGSVSGGVGARESISIARLAFTDLEKRPAVVGLININSPLRLDVSMAEALLEYVQAGQPVLLTPGILMGITAPVTAAGALAQGFAELIGTAVLTQVVRPGSPVIIGLGGFGSDLRSGGTAFGSPENSLATYTGAQISRKLNIPYRCSAAVTSSMLPDCRSGYERMMTAMAAFNSGVHFCLQAAGILDSINAMSFEQYMIDLEIWGYIKRLSDGVRVDDETLALDLIKANNGGDYLSLSHTIEHMRREIYAPTLFGPESYESWWAGAGRDVLTRASENLRKLQSRPCDAVNGNGLCKELDKYVQSRRQEIEGKLK